MRTARALRNDNVVRVMEALLARESLSRTEICQLTGLSAATVMRIVDDLSAYKLVTELESEGVASVGRPPSAVTVNPSSYVFASVLFEGLVAQFGIVNMLGQVLKSHIINVEGGVADLLEGKAAQVISALMADPALQGSSLRWIGLGLPAILDPYTNRIITAPLIDINQEVDLSASLARLAESLGAQVRIENDVNAMAVGEQEARRYGADTDFAYVALGTGIGCGLILRGELRRGRNNTAGEIGYSLVNGDAAQGNLESRIGLASLGAKYGVTDWRHLTDEQRHAVIGAVVDLLAPCLINLSIAMDLDVIVVGGQLVAYLGDAFVRCLNAAVARRSPMLVKVEKGKEEIPGIVGMGVIARGLFLKQVRKGGLETLEKKSGQ